MRCHLKPELVLENGFLEQLREMISDSNPMVRRLYSVDIVFRVSSSSDATMKGRSEHHYCSVRYSYGGNVAAVHFLVRPSYIHRYPDNPEQTPNRAQRMLRVGPRRHTVCAGTVPGTG